MVFFFFLFSVKIMVILALSVCDFPLFATTMISSDKCDCYKCGTILKKEHFSFPFICFILSKKKYLTFVEKFMCTVRYVQFKIINGLKLSSQVHKYGDAKITCLGVNFPLLNQNLWIYSSVSLWPLLAVISICRPILFITYFEHSSIYDSNEKVY